MMKKPFIPATEVEFRKAGTEDVNKLLNYLNDLSSETKHRFGPHKFDVETLEKLLKKDSGHILYVAEDQTLRVIVAYFIVRKGYLEHDSPRLSSYGLILNHHTDCTLAPSVADHFQGEGIGQMLHRFIVEDLKAFGFKRIILWGGVQVNNERALHFYRKSGYHHLGEFEYYGMNFDMALNI